VRSSATADEPASAPARWYASSMKGCHSETHARSIPAASRTARTAVRTSAAWSGSGPPPSRAASHALPSANSPSGPVLPHRNFTACPRDARVRARCDQQGEVRAKGRGATERERCDRKGEVRPKGRCSWGGAPAGGRGRALERCLGSCASHHCASSPWASITRTKKRGGGPPAGGAGGASAGSMRRRRAAPCFVPTKKAAGFTRGAKLGAQSAGESGHSARTHANSPATCSCGYRRRSCW
jgi:hypothetical protein